MYNRNVDYFRCNNNCLQDLFVIIAAYFDVYVIILSRFSFPCIFFALILSPSYPFKHSSFLNTLSSTRFPFPIFFRSIII